MRAVYAYHSVSTFRKGAQTTGAMCNHSPSLPQKSLRRSTLSNIHFLFLCKWYFYGGRGVDLISGSTWHSVETVFEEVGAPVQRGP